MAKTVKMCDMPIHIAAKVLELLNPGKVKYVNEAEIELPMLITDVEPNQLDYPEGWYYAKGTFRNKHTSTTGIYQSIDMVMSNGQYWEELAKYSTLERKL